jgi:hypothetical protein
MPENDLTGGPNQSSVMVAHYSGHADELQVFAARGADHAGLILDPAHVEVLTTAIEWAMT